MHSLSHKPGARVFCVSGPGPQPQDLPQPQDAASIQIELPGDPLTGDLFIDHDWVREAALQAARVRRNRVRGARRFVFSFRWSN